MGEEQRITRPATERALSEFRAVGRTAFLAKYGFGESREYFVRDPVTGELADSKAIVGAAYGYAFPEIGALKSTDFIGGASTVGARMKDLGFEVISASSNWSDKDLALVIFDYLAMLAREVRELPYVASDHLNRMRRAIRIRSTDEVTILYRQISGALRRRGLRFLPAFQPIDTSSVQLHELLHQSLSRNAGALRRLLPTVPCEKTSRVECDARI